MKLSTRTDPIYAEGPISTASLGPHPVSMVTDFVRARLVTQAEVPVILHDGQRYAVLAPPNNNLRVICAGCFKPGMSLLDDSRSKKVSSFSQHWATKLVDGERVRKHRCIGAPEDSLAAMIDRIDATEETVQPLLDSPIHMNEPADPPSDRIDPPTGRTPCSHGIAPVDLSSASNLLLLEELRRRGITETVLTDIDEEILINKLKQYGVKFLIDARPDDLKAELYRQATFSDVGDYWFGDKVAGVPSRIDVKCAPVKVKVHVSFQHLDETPVVKRALVDIVYNTRSKKAK
jgi:hypothetical protein